MTTFAYPVEENGKGCLNMHFTPSYLQVLKKLRITESSRLEKTFRVIMPNHQHYLQVTLAINCPHHIAS